MRTCALSGKEPDIGEPTMMLWRKFVAAPGRARAPVHTDCAAGRERTCKKKKKKKDERKRRKKFICFCFGHDVKRKDTHQAKLRKKDRYWQ